jgi:hypothetical protein
MKVRSKHELAYGWAEYDMLDRVRVGDRVIPRRIDVTIPKTGDLPSFSMRMEVRRGVPVCTEVTVRAKDDGREVRTTDLRAVQIEDWLEDVVAAASLHVISESEGSVTAEHRGDADARRAAIKTIREARAASRRKITDELLERVAEVYRENVHDHPTQAVERAFGVSYRTASRYVQMARPKYLPPTSPGKKSG